MQQALADPPTSPSKAVISKSGDVRPAARIRWSSLLQFGLLGFAIFLLALHFVHLAADFPNHSPWMDWSKYTDEGWYGDGAIRQAQLGHWYVGGDFNPAAALPVWPLLEFGLFSLTGVSLVAARALSVAVFGATLVVAYGLARRSSPGRAVSALAPAAGVALLAASPFCYAFTRLAILEPLLVLLGMLALLAASLEGRWTKIVWLGVLIPAMVLTKTTAIFLLPAIAWMLWAGVGYRVREFLRVGVPAAGVAALLWASYFFLAVSPRFLEDYRYLFSANAYTGITRDNALGVIMNTVRGGMWIGKMIYPVALLALLLAAVFFQRTFRNPLIPALTLWVLGYGAFLAYHNNLQPRYYLVIAIPLTLLAAIASGEVYSVVASPGPRAVFLAVAMTALAAVLGTETVKTIGYVRHPEYTFVEAAQALQRVVVSDNTGHSKLVLSISGSDLSLITGLPSICDDFGTMTLEDRVAKYRPGWYATWNQVDDDKMDALAPLYHLKRVATFPAFDDPERNLLILYRLDPPDEVTPRRKGRNQVPKRLQTKLGQQPSASQLEH